MKCIILCRERINGIEEVAKKNSCAEITVGTRTVLAKLLDGLIAIGVNKAFVVCQSTDGGIDRTIGRYEYLDKISVEVAKLPRQIFYDCQGDWLVCDAWACANADIADLFKRTPDNTALETKDGHFIMARLSEGNVKQHDFTDEDSLFSQILERCGKYDKKNAKHTILSSVADILNYQAEILYKNVNSVTSLTDCNFNGATIIPPAFIGKNVVIGSGVVVGQGSVIGDNARICDNASVIGSFVGDNAVVGRCCSVNKAYICSNAVLMNRVRLSAYSVVSDGTCVKSNTIVGESSVISPVSERFKGCAFERFGKPLEFDDDGICSLYDGSSDVLNYCRLGKAIGSAIDIGKSIVVGAGNNIGCDMLTKALCSGACSCGVNVLDIGVSTLPQLGHAVGRTGSEIGVYIGVDANGDVRLIQSYGLPLITRLEETIVENYEKMRFRTAALCDHGKSVYADSEKSAYFGMLSSILPKSLKGNCVSVRTNDRTAAELCDKLFCPANDTGAQSLVFQLSSDLTTLNAYSEETGNVRWEQLCLLGCKIMFENNRPVVLPYSIPVSVERLAARLQGTVYRYCTVNVDTSDFAARNAVCQAQGNFAADALLLAVMICRYLNDRQIRLKAALDDIEPVCCTQRFLSGLSQEAFCLENAQAVGCEGVRVSDENTTAFVRPSKNRRSVMIYAESTSSEFASAFCDKLSERIRKLGNIGKDR